MSGLFAGTEGPSGKQDLRWHQHHDFVIDRMALRMIDTKGTSLYIGRRDCAVSYFGRS